MKWEEVRRLYPDSFVLSQILDSHIKDDKRYIDDVAIIKVIDNPSETMHELVNAKPGIMLYHTKKVRIEVLIRKSIGLRKVM